MLATVAGPRCPVPVIGAPQRRRARLGRRGRRGDRGLRLRPQPRGAGRRRGRRAGAAPGWSRSARPTRELQALAERARAPFVPVPRRAPARASLWALTVPVLLAARALGPGQGQRGRPRRDRGPARRRRRALPARRRVVRQPGQVAGARTWPARSRSSGARRRWPPWPPAGSATCCPPTPATRWSPARSARPGRGRVGLLDGVFGGLAEAERDIFADPDEERRREHPAAAGAAARRRAQRRGRRPTSRSRSRSGAPTRCRPSPSAAACAATWSPPRAARALERLASLVAVPDFASVYLALAHGLDPMAVPADHRDEGAGNAMPDEAAVSAGGGTKAIVAALLANLGIAVTKFIAFAADRLVVDAGRVDPLGRRLRQPGAAAARRQAGQAARPPRSTRSGTAGSATSTRSSSSIVLFSVGGLFALYEAYHKLAAPGRRSPRGSGCRSPCWSSRSCWSRSPSGPRSRSPTRSAATRPGCSSSAGPRRPELPVVLLEDLGALVGLVFALFGVGADADHRQRHLGRASAPR